MSERLSSREIDIVTNDYPELTTVLAWFDFKARQHVPPNRSIADLVYRYGIEQAGYPVSGNGEGIATILIEEVWKMNGGIMVENDRVTYAAQQAIDGNPQATEAALKLYEGKMLTGTEEQLLGVSHLIAAIHEGADEDKSFEDQAGRIQDHFNTGAMYLARAIALKAPLYQTETANTTS